MQKYIVELCKKAIVKTEETISITEKYAIELRKHITVYQAIIDRNTEVKP
jgi:hypothetical protein